MQHGRASARPIVPSAGNTAGSRYPSPMPLLEARALGRKRALVPSRSFDLPAAEGDAPLPLRDLIDVVVRSEVEAYVERAQARLFVRCLTEAEIAEGAEAGKVDAGGREVTTEVDADAAVRTALQAFEDGLYLVLVDGEECADLDGPVALTDASSVAFVRLTFLAGA